jgi:hypothetical protein
MATMSPYEEKTKQKEIRQIAVAAVEALVYKESKATKYGLLFHRKDSNSPLTIQEIRTTGIFHSSNLESGMHVLEINGIESIWLSPVEGGRLLRHAEVGTQLSIKAARPRTIKATKGSKESKWGFVIKNSTAQPGLFVGSIAENSPFADTDLRIGMKIIQINGRPCPQQVREASKMLKASAAKMEITVVQLDTLEARDEMDEICLWKDIVEACGRWYNPKSIQEKKPEVKNMGKKESKGQVKKQSKKKVDPEGLRPVRCLSVIERSRLPVPARSKNDE